MSYSKEVETANGVKKNVVAGTQEELDEAVKAAQDEPKQVSPDIDNPEHGNLTTAQFMEQQGVGTKATEGALNGPEGSTDEAVPSSNSAKKVAKKASADAGMLEDGVPEK